MHLIVEVIGRQLSTKCVYQLSNTVSFLILGANYLIRKMASHSNPTLDITQEGETFTFVLHSMFTTRNFKFTVGETYEETQHNGTIMQVGGPHHEISQA